MLAITHTITSAAVGATVPSALLAFGISVLLHLFLDTLLHWNIYIGRHRWPYFWVALDVFGGLLAAYWLAPSLFLTLPMLSAIIGGNAPDIWHVSIITLERFQRSARPKGPFFRFHEWLQNETLNPWKGLAWQGLLVALAVFVIKRSTQS